MSDDPKALTAELAKAADGLLYPSESDEPFEAFAWPATHGETAKQAVERHAPGKRPVVEQSVNAFFAALDGSDDADRYQTLLNLVTRKLNKPTVIRAGAVQVAVYLIGLAGGQWVGLRTTSIET